MSVAEMCWGDTGLLLSVPRQGLGNSAHASDANDEQLERFQGTWAAVALTEPAFGSDSAQVSTTAKPEGDHYVHNGKKHHVPSHARPASVVVLAPCEQAHGRAATQSCGREKE